MAAAPAERDVSARYYAGIGSRETPRAVLREFWRLGRDLAHRGMTLRSGGADGADSAFEGGCDSVNGPKQIFLPWDGFQGRHEDRTPDRRVYVGVGPQALDLAGGIHPAWKSCSRGARALHARNGYQVLGPKLDTPVDFVICWTKHGLGQGGTGQAIRIALDRGIRVYDVGNEETPHHLKVDLGIDW